MMRFKLNILIIALSFFTLSATVFADRFEAEAGASITESFDAASVTGELSPPDYGLRLDGFFDNKSQHEVVFSFEKVKFDIYDNGKANLYGNVLVEDFDDDDFDDEDVSLMGLDGTDLQWSALLTIQNIAACGGAYL